MFEFNEFKPRLQSPKNRFQLSVGLNLEKLFKLNQPYLSRRSKSLNSASDYMKRDILSLVTIRWFMTYKNLFFKAFPEKTSSTFADMMSQKGYKDKKYIGIKRNDFEIIFKTT